MKQKQKEEEEKKHFFFSREQYLLKKEIDYNQYRYSFSPKKDTYVKIGDKWELYTEMSSSRSSNPNFPDMIYLGEGTYDDIRTAHKHSDLPSLIKSAN